jgi:hypothetical protein
VSSPREAAIANLQRMLAHDIMDEAEAHAIVEAAIEQLKLGALNKDDRGALAVAMRAEEGTVIVSFGTPLEWLGLSPNQARTFAAGLLAHAVTATAQRSGTHDEEATGPATGQEEGNGAGRDRPAAAHVSPVDPHDHDPRD